MFNLVLVVVLVVALVVILIVIRHLVQIPRIPDYVTDHEQHHDQG